jgi:hypothetical protein
LGLYGEMRSRPFPTLCLPCPLWRSVACSEFAWSIGFSNSSIEALKTVELAPRSRARTGDSVIFLPCCYSVVQISHVACSDPHWCTVPSCSVEFVRRRCCCSAMHYSRVVSS